jgi:hypothetical protein
MTTRERYVEKLLKSCSTFLARWKDADALLWELTSSHKSLTIVLTRAGSHGNLVLACLGPVWLHGPVRWERSDLSVSEARLPDGGDGFRVSDRGSQVEILCEAVEIAENRKLRHWS